MSPSGARIEIKESMSFCFSVLGGLLLLTEDDQKKKPKYYDVEEFRKIFLDTSRTRGPLGRFLNRITGFFDSIQGFFVALLGLPILFGTLLAVVVGAYFGLWGFLAVFGSIIGGLTLYVEHKVGASLQFGEYKFWRRAFAQAVAFLMAVGLIFFLIFVSKFRLF